MKEKSLITFQNCPSKTEKEELDGVYPQSSTLNYEKCLIINYYLIIVAISVVLYLFSISIL